MNSRQPRGLIPRVKMTETTSLTELLQRDYGLAVAKVIPLKTVSGIVCTDESRWIWKKARAKDTEERFQAMNEIQALLGASGITCAAPVSKLDGRYLSSYVDGEQTGYLQSWLGGHHVQLDNRQERLAAFATIAVMHQLGQFGSQDAQRVLAAGNLQTRLVKKHRAMVEAWSIAKQRLPELKLMESTIFRGMHRVLERFSHWRLTGQATFCHRDLAPHNLLFSDQGRPQISLIDLDQAGYDLPYLDLLQLCNHSLHFSDFQPGELREVLRVYQRNYPMLPEQQLWLRELLWFPDLLIRTTVEWAAYGCPDKGREKVWTAARKEQLRLRILQTESAFEM